MGLKSKQDLIANYDLAYKYGLKTNKKYFLNGWKVDYHLLLQYLKHGAKSCFHNIQCLNPRHWNLVDHENFIVIKPHANACFAEYQIFYIGSKSLASQISTQIKIRRFQVKFTNFHLCQYNPNPELSLVCNFKQIFGWKFDRSAILRWLAIKGAKSCFGNLQCLNPKCWDLDISNLFTLVMPYPNCAWNDYQIYLTGGCGTIAREIDSNVEFKKIIFVENTPQSVYCMDYYEDSNGDEIYLT